MATDDVEFVAILTLRYMEPHLMGLAHDWVEQNAPDLVVMSSHGRSGFGRWLLGSVTESLARRIHTPILVVPARDEAEVRKLAND